MSECMTDERLAGRKLYLESISISPFSRDVSSEISLITELLSLRAELEKARGERDSHRAGSNAKGDYLQRAIAERDSARALLAKALPHLNWLKIDNPIFHASIAAELEK